MDSQSLVEVLLVEDNDDDAVLAERAFRKQGFANPMRRVKDGEEALEYLSGRPHPNLRVILLDLKLPKVSGLEILETIRNDERLKKLPVVVMTSSREDEDIQEAYRLGANGFIVKPLDFSEFVNIVGSLGNFWLLVNQLPQQ